MSTNIDTKPGAGEKLATEIENWRKLRRPLSMQNAESGNGRLLTEVENLLICAALRSYDNPREALSDAGGVETDLFSILSTEEKYLHDHLESLLTENYDGPGLMHGDIEGSFHRLRSAARALAPTAPVASEELVERALQHGEYLAKSVEKFLGFLNSERALHNVEHQDELTGHWRGLESAVYEFRKRHKRAALSAANLAPSLSAFDFLERLSDVVEKTRPELANDLRACFARGTGGIDVEGIANLGGTPVGCGIIRKIGWAKNDEGREIFRAVIEFPNRPPDLTINVVWDELPILLTIAQQPEAHSPQSETEAKNA